MFIGAVDTKMATHDHMRRQNEIELASLKIPRLVMFSFSLYNRILQVDL